jgi:hypothetical protein
MTRAAMERDGTHRPGGRDSHGSFIAVRLVVYRSVRNARPAKTLAAPPKAIDPIWRTAFLEGILILVEIGIRRHDAANQNTEALPQNLLGPYQWRRPHTC